MSTQRMSTHSLSDLPAAAASAAPAARRFARPFRGARPLLVAATLAVIVPGLAQAGQGFRGAHNDDHRDGGPRDERGYVLDNRYNHNHYYPPRGFGVPALPRGSVTINYRGGPYYYHQGAYYRPGPRGFVVVRPAIGLFVPVLPPFYTTVYFGGIPYYYADDTYYVWRSERRAYVVTEPPAGASESTATSQPAGSSDELFIYPKNGQSEEQQSKDRYECHSWAASQTGFDPTQPLGGVDESKARGKREDYHRAMTACLDARGYSVK